MAGEYQLDGEGNPVFPKDFSSPPGQAPRRSDDDIKRDVESIMFYDDLVRSYEIAMAVENAVVTLTGTVSNDMERRRAEEDAWKAFGVRQVVNNIQIGMQRTG